MEKYKITSIAMDPKAKQYLESIVNEYYQQKSLYSNTNDSAPMSNYNQKQQPSDINVSV